MKSIEYVKMSISTLKTRVHNKYLFLLECNLEFDLLDIKMQYKEPSKASSLLH